MPLICQGGIPLETWRGDKSLLASSKWDRSRGDPFTVTCGTSSTIGAEDEDEDEDEDGVDGRVVGEVDGL